MGYGKDIDWEKLEQSMKPVEIVLDYDLEKLRRTDTVKRIGLWNEIESSLASFDEDVSFNLDDDLRRNYRGKFALAELLISTASRLNNEDSTTMGSFNEKEMLLIQDFERYNVFDILSVDEIVERIVRRDELFSLVREIYEKQYTDLDTLLDAPEVQQNLKLAFKKRYAKRLDHIKDGVKAYVDKYGPVFMVRQIEEKVWEKVRESAEDRERVSAALQTQLEELMNRLKPLDRMEEESLALEEKLIALEKALLEGVSPDTDSLELEKEQLSKRFEELERELATEIDRLDNEMASIDKTKAGLDKLAEDYRRQAEEQKQRIVESEIDALERTCAELASRKQSLEEQRRSLEIRRHEVGERLKQLLEVATGGGIRWVTKEDARLAELNFIARFDHKMQQFPLQVFSPIENKEFVVKSWDEGSHVRRSQVISNPDSPSNEISRYIVSERKYKVFGDRVRKVIIEAVSFSHLAELTERGFDIRRANLGEFLRIINSRIKTAEIGQYLHVLGIASPTGWHEGVTCEISADTFARNYVSQYVSVCLIDSITGEVYHNPLDKRITSFVDLFKPELPEEKVEMLKRRALDQLRLKGFIAFQDFAKEASEPRTLLLNAFFVLVKEGKAKARIMKDIGLVLEANS